MTAKRKRHAVEDEEAQEQSPPGPKRIFRRTISEDQGEGNARRQTLAAPDAGTPIKRGRGRPPGIPGKKHKSQPNTKKGRSEVREKPKPKPVSNGLGQKTNDSPTTPKSKGRPVPASQKSVRFTSQGKSDDIWSISNLTDEKSILAEPISDDEEEAQGREHHQEQADRIVLNQFARKSKHVPSGLPWPLDEPPSNTLESKANRSVLPPTRDKLGGRIATPGSRTSALTSVSMRRTSLRSQAREKENNSLSNENSLDDDEYLTAPDVEEDEGEEGEEGEEEEEEEEEGEEEEEEEVSDAQDYEGLEDEYAKNLKPVLNRVAGHLDRSSPIPAAKFRPIVAKSGEPSNIGSDQDLLKRRKSSRLPRGADEDSGDERYPLLDANEGRQEVDGKGAGDEELSEESEDEEAEGDLFAPIPSTPPKRNTKKVRKARRKRSLTPPEDLLPHELYFLQNHSKNMKTSNNTLSSLSLLSHEQYHNNISVFVDPHASSIKFLHSLHSRSFPQWNFELSQSFNICLYGYGSKRHLVTDFANHLSSLRPSLSPPKIVIINGYTPALKIRQVLTTIATVAFDAPASSLKLGAQPRDIINSILIQLVECPPSSPIYIFINSLDAPPLRRNPIPSMFATLASSSHIHLLATCDNPSFQRLFDSSAREQFNFLFHDTTTFESYAPVEVGSVVDTMNELLRRSGRSMKGKEGVGFVLRSLPENARNLYRILIAELLAAMDNGIEDNDALDPEGGSRKVAGGVGVVGRMAVRVLYQKAVEEFICTSDMAFRTLLKEFQDHQMVDSKWDGAGTEMIGVPFRREEMESILEDLVV